MYKYKIQEYHKESFLLNNTSNNNRGAESRRKLKFVRLPRGFGDHGTGLSGTRR